MKDSHIPTGNALTDNFLEGGYEPGIITTIYGPSGSGKTSYVDFTSTMIFGGMSGSALPRLTSKHANP